MLIGEVARRSGVSARMLRHYDRLGLVRPTGRTDGGYREYSEEDVRRVLHVESLRSLGLSLAEVRRALDDPSSTPAGLLAGLVAETERRVAQGEELLARLRRVDATSPGAWDEVLRVLPLLRTLEDPRAGRRQRLALSSAHDLPAEALADAYLGETETNVAGALGWALARAGEGALTALAEGLRSPDPEVRRRAVAGLATVEDDAATDALVTALADPDEDVRDRAALAVGARGGREAVPVLVAMVVDGRLDVEAAETLGLLTAMAVGAEEVVAALVAAARDGAPAVRRRLAQALAELPCPGARRALTALARDEDRSVSLTARAVLHRTAAPG
ncbi:MerR family transcriptional regulator [Georgenia sp. 311]|uniref:MerR family transcriptional regulator n=1 Tax=Georgenia wutianyii TaxID=2585135 RepID=A0ABX5VK15_9MICO|nr:MULTISPECIES: HEAT repeat domain-containing protein [Georgenia]QDB78148.1 MerR family transcriptional regulator [Georgenia wutianyii]TNC17593.1 MerR family transcriptional regulator [Georgenia sp. 311]